MIRNTFCILNGIGEKLERRLWRDGILTWSDFLDAQAISFIGREKKSLYDQFLSSAASAIENEDAEYFAASIRRRDHWRLFQVFKHNCACLDIETSGLTPDQGGVVTVVGLYNGSEYLCFVRGENLTAEAVRQELSKYKYLVTFYGAGFDIPFLMRTMPGLSFDLPHFDICYGARKIGFRGGLKKLETELGIPRDKNVEGMDGYDAVRLWTHAKNGSREALELLKLYNREDTINLYKIAEIIYDNLRMQTGITEYM